MKNLALTCIVLTALAASLPAQADNGIYIGGGIGGSDIQDAAGKPAGLDASGTDFAYKGFLGYYMDTIPLVRLAAEVGYRDLGEPESDNNGITSSYRLKGIDYSVMAGLGLGPVDLFAKVGGMQYDLTKTHAGVGTDFDGTAPLYGIGLWFSIAGIGVRAEYEVVDVDELDTVQSAMISAFYRF
jgi:hypothetical protein